LDSLKSIAEVSELQNPNYKLQIRWEPISKNPAINIFRQFESEGGRAYLTDENVGYSQCHGTYAKQLLTSNSSNIVSIPREAWPDLSNDNPVLHLLFEGREKGKGKLIIEVVYNQSVRFAFTPVFLNLVDVQDMYEKWTVGDSGGPGVNYRVWPDATPSQTGGQNLNMPKKRIEKDYFLFVHGWNMSAKDKDYFASTAFKRLWHQGYQGRFGAFSWPTFYFDTPAPSIDNFDASEERAWSSASPLKWLIQKLGNTYSDGGRSLVRLYAHSMGNIVASECLRQGAPVHTYISAQAALSAHAWDNRTESMSFTYGLGPSTPDVYGYHWQVGATSEPHVWKKEQRPTYLDSSCMPSSTRYINHYNPLDWALSYGRWQLNQMLKPNIGYEYGANPSHDITSSTHRFYTFGLGSTWSDLMFPNDRFRVFSFCAESHSYAVGQDGATQGMFGMIVDLNADYSFGSAHKGHSAQFRSFIQKRWTYWRSVLDDMQIDYPSNL
jgi:hypothetical protein